MRTSRGRRPRQGDGEYLTYKVVSYKRRSLKTVLNVWNLDLPGLVRFKFRFGFCHNMGSDTILVIHIDRFFEGRSR